MAHLFKRPRSPFWWIAYRDPKKPTIDSSGRPRPIRKATPYRHGVGNETRLAREYEARLTLNERAFTRSNPEFRWINWVKPFIYKHTTGRTTERYLTAWRMLDLYLDEVDVKSPDQITYELCDNYLAWRAKADYEQGKYRCCRNTAILEIKIFRWLMREAVRRGFCAFNPVREIILKRDPRKEFPDLTDEQLKAIWVALEAEPDATCLKRSFAIGLLQGVRLNETNVHPINDIANGKDHWTIAFNQKGGRRRVKPLNPQLIPLFKRLRAENAKQTYPMAFKHGRWAWGARWTYFFQRRPRKGPCFKKQIPNVCFHSLRVTVENTLRLAGIPKEIRELYLSHEHQRDVNSSYDRIKISEMLVCHKPLTRSWLEL